jgi:hypothetical protein
VVSIANPAAPSRPELDAGTNLSPELADWDGWSEEPELLDGPDLGSRRTKQVVGPINPSQPTITMYASRTGTDARQLMGEGAVGFVVFADGGDVPGQRMDVYPVTVSAVVKQRSATGSAIDSLLISFAITGDPQPNIIIPA